MKTPAAIVVEQRKPLVIDEVEWVCDLVFSGGRIII